MLRKSILIFILKIGVIVFCVLRILIAQVPNNTNKVLNLNNKESKKMKRTDSEWKRILTSAEYHILREKDLHVVRVQVFHNRIVVCILQ